MLSEKLMIYDNLVKDIPFFNNEVNDYLLKLGYFEDDIFKMAIQRTRELLSLTEKLQLKWSRPDSPYIIGLLSEIYKLFYNREVVIDEGETLMGSDKVINRKTKQFKADEFYPESLELSIFMIATLGKLTEEEIFCIKYCYDANEIAIHSYPNIVWVNAVNKQIIGEFSANYVGGCDFGVTPSNIDE